MPWILTRGEQRWEGIPPGRATANSPDLLMRLARAGAGIAVVKRPLRRAVRAQRRTGPGAARLAVCRRSTAWAVFPGRRLMPARTRVFLDALAAKFSGPECQVIASRTQETMARARAAP